MDSRFPSDWLHDYRVQTLSAEAFRLLINANTWSVSNRTDGAILRHHLVMIPHANEALAAELANTGLWNSAEEGWLIVDYSRYQTTRAQFEGLEHKRKLEAEASRAYRNRQKIKKQMATSHTSEPPSYDGSHDDQATGSYDDKGKATARQGKEQPLSTLLSAKTPAIADNLAIDPDAWPTDNFGVECRTFCEDHHAETVQQLTALGATQTQEQARKVLAAAFPGRRF